MAVYIQGKCDSGMTEVFRYRFDIVPVFKADRSERMPEIMKPDIRQADRCDPGFEGMVHRARADVISRLVCENKIIFIPVTVPAFQLVFRLLAFHLFQEVEDSRGGGDDSGLSVFECIETIFVLPGILRKIDSRNTIHS